MTLVDWLLLAVLAFILGFVARHIIKGRGG